MNRLLLSTLSATSILASLISTATAEIAVKNGDKIGFLGDSITAGGWSNPAGYVRLVIAGLAANGINAEAIPAGISGNKSHQMLARVDQQILSKKPQWMTLSCGVNDVWHGKNGVPLDDAQAASGAFEKRANEPEKGTYKANITAIIDKAKAAGAQPIILTPTVIKEDLNSPENQKLAPYNAFLRDLAKEKNIRIADLNATFQEKIKAAATPGKNVLTGDGVHFNQEGNIVAARVVLTAMGASAEEIGKAETAWEPLKAKQAEAAKAAAEKKAADAAAKKEKAEAEKKAAEAAKPAAAAKQ